MCLNTNMKKSYKYFLRLLILIIVLGSLSWIGVIFNRQLAMQSKINLKIKNNLSYKKSQKSSYGETDLKTIKSISYDIFWKKITIKIKNDLLQETKAKRKKVILAGENIVAKSISKYNKQQHLKSWNWYRSTNVYSGKEKLASSYVKNNKAYIKWKK
ncbi:hypothetical protein OENOO_60077 [Oenococcus oeni ATCC BAA-1163]|uniref:Uncharacterized protein n=1 Tax=Oenococcus oeni ATCC BAA-1163 TaxID=379360 RepID=A0NJY6_OENOE|nr:hypothetical protein OENOO_60077 [Oenococcus oeni ATCC BAA-1163]